MRAPVRATIGPTADSIRSRRSAKALRRRPSSRARATPTFHGNAERWNPEELLLAALSQCHMLAYLHVAVRNGVTVVAYSDSAVGLLRQLPAGGGSFASATLRPQVTITDPNQIDFAQSLHAEAARECFIAASMNFPVGHEPVTTA